jgi:hypothetical protein
MMEKLKTETIEKHYSIMETRKHYSCNAKKSFGVFNYIKSLLKDGDIPTKCSSWNAVSHTSGIAAASSYDIDFGIGINKFS